MCEHMTGDGTAQADIRERSMRRGPGYWFNQLGGAYLILALAAAALMFAMQLVNFGD